MSNVDQVAQALNITVRRVNQLAAEGAIPREGRGEYNLGKCMASYIRYLQAALAKKGTMDGSGEIRSLKDSREELVRVQTERERFELSKARGDVIPTEAHERILADLIQETKARVRAVGARIAHDLVGESRLVIQAKLEKAHDEALVQLSKIVPRVTAADLQAEGEEKGLDPKVVAPREDHVEGEKAKIVKVKPKKAVAPVAKPKPKAKAAKRGR